jgi:hypothetical protein
VSNKINLVVSQTKPKNFYRFCGFYFFAFCKDEAVALTAFLKLSEGILDAALPSEKL